MEQKNLEKFISTEIILKLDYGWKEIEQYEKEESCVICFDSMKDKYILELDCKHIYHYDCILDAVILHNFKQCPECKKKFSNN